MYSTFMTHGQDSAEYQGMMAEWRDNIGRHDAYMITLLYLLLQVSGVLSWKRVNYCCEHSESMLHIIIGYFRDCTFGSV